MNNKTNDKMPLNSKKATFGAGCFWCTEAVYSAVEGVIKVEPGYMGGKTINPTYNEVCEGDTGHAEVIEITFDATKTSFENLLLIFFKTHDATTLNRQGGDVGTQYRSVVFYYSEEQKQQTEQMISQLTEEKIFDAPIVTEVSPVEEFYRAEDYHHNYFINNRNQPYCMAVIEPKLSKFAANFRDKIKKELL
jgi:peptide-methionine (S)-S-oxide reductase